MIGVREETEILRRVDGIKIEIENTAGGIMTTTDLIGRTDPLAVTEADQVAVILLAVHVMTMMTIAEEMIDVIGIEIVDEIAMTTRTIEETVTVTVIAATEMTDTAALDIRRIHRGMIEMIETETIAADAMIDMSISKILVILRNPMSTTFHTL